MKNSLMSLGLIAVIVVIAAAVLFGLNQSNAGTHSAYQVINIANSQNLTFANSGFAIPSCAEMLPIPVFNITGATGFNAVMLNYGAYGNVIDYMIQPNSKGTLNFTVSYPISEPAKPFLNATVYLDTLALEEGNLVGVTNGIKITECSGYANSIVPNSNTTTTTVMPTCTNQTMPGVTAHYVSSVGDNYSYGIYPSSNGTTDVPNQIMFYSSAKHGINFTVSPTKFTLMYGTSAKGAINVTVADGAPAMTYYAETGAEFCGGPAAEFMVTVGSIPYNGPLPMLPRPA